VYEKPDKNVNMDCNVEENRRSRVRGSMQTLHLLFMFGVLFMVEKTNSAVYRVSNMESNMQHLAEKYKQISLYLQWLTFL
jgi:hypothetical protein